MAAGRYQRPAPASEIAGAATAIAAAVPALAKTATADGDAQIEQLWIERTALIAEWRALHRAYDDALARLPAWAQPGPAMLRSDGNYVGADVGWPRIEGAADIQRGSR